MSGPSEGWVPTRWWRVLAADGSLWCETSDEDEARRALHTAPGGGHLSRLWSTPRDAQWWRPDGPSGPQLPTPEQGHVIEAMLSGVNPYGPGRWAARNVDHDAPWRIRADGKVIGADRMRTAAQLAAWQQMRAHMPSEHWSPQACDAIAEAVLRTVRDWIEAP